MSDLKQEVQLVIVWLQVLQFRSQTALINRLFDVWSITKLSEVND